MEPLVSIFSLAYNHAPYIRQCLDGFLMQKTNFPFEVIINDDCSTDGTTEIIKEYAEKYPEIIKPIFHVENQYSKGIRGMFYRFCYPKSKGKYIALCEGDDYWVDPLKLQKQVDFLESHKEFGLVHTRAWIYSEKKRTIEDDLLGVGNNSLMSELLRNNIATLTVCIRRDIVGSYIREVLPKSSDWKMGDYPLWLWSAGHMRIGFMNDVTAVYRVLLESASHSNDKGKIFDFAVNAFEISLFFSDKFNIPKTNRKILINKRIWTLVDLLVHGRIRSRVDSIIKIMQDNYSNLNIKNKLFFIFLNVTGFLRTISK